MTPEEEAQFKKARRGRNVALSLPVAFRRAAEGDTMKPEKSLFTYSVFYLFALFTALVVDRMMLA